MAIIVQGIVRDGKIVPEAPLPEGLRVQILLPENALSVPGDIQAELDAWALGNAQALERVEQLADEGVRNAEG